jgi:hypothetical protein
MRNDDPRMGVEQRSDEAMPGSRVPDEHAIGLYAAEEFRIAPAVQERSCVQAKQVQFPSK